MADDLEILKKTIEEHRLIHENITSVSERANDVNAQVLLDWERADLAVSGADSMDEKVDTLKKSVAALQVNLGRHFGFEETYLPPVLGPELMNILLRDHVAIRAALEQAGKQLSAFKSGGLDNSTLLDKKMELIAVVSDVTDLIKEHALKEDTILRGKKRELENAGSGKAS
jgi:hypothetical protein